MSARTRSPLTRLEERACDALDTNSLVSAAQTLVRIPSWGGQESTAQEAVAALASAAGLDVDRWDIDLDEVMRHPLCSWEIERERGIGVGATLNGSGGGRRLLLNGHVDVVPPGDESLWRHPPFSAVIDQGRIHGRGAVDMKGPLMAGLHAMKAVRDAGIVLHGRVDLVSVIAEEDGGLGTLASILRGYRGDGAIVMEPTELAVAPVQAGCVNFRIRVRGNAAHGAVREEGLSAFDNLIAVHETLRALEERRNANSRHDPLFARYRLPFPISVGTFRGGEWASSVPERACLEGRMGVKPGEELAEARSELEHAVAEAATRTPALRLHPPVVEWWGGRFLPSRLDVAHPLTTSLLGAAAEVLGREPGLEAVTFGADAGLLTHAGGTPTVLFGAGDIRHAHRPDEYVAIRDLEQMARALVVTIMRFCGVDADPAS